ncbi:MAG: hypothetical protein K2N64_07380 [Anaeroplasmataceae bacterium]|nr:hypothetical protein [Anaeroplasmataceae bacterium]
MEANEVENQKKPSVFLIFSLVLLCFPSILSLILVATEKWNLRKYEFSLILWLSIVGICESISIIVYLILQIKQKRTYPYPLALVTAISTISSSLFVLIEYLLYWNWYKQKSLQEAWNVSITYTLNAFVLFLGIINVLLFIFYIYFLKRKNNQNK